MTPRTADATASGSWILSAFRKRIAPKKTRLRLVVTAHLPSSQGSCAAFLREGNIVGRHGWTWTSRSQPGRPACPAYAASPPPPRPPVRLVRPSGRTGCTPAPLPEGSAARRNTRRVSASYCRQGPARCRKKGQRSPLIQVKGHQRRWAQLVLDVHSRSALWDKEHLPPFPQGKLVASQHSCQHINLEHQEIQFRIQSWVVDSPNS